jgi:sugar/nucleoside kinase (ribokinase family)
MGAGDAALAGFALSLSSGASIMESAYIASSMSAIAVNRMGNVPVQASDVKEFIRFKMGKPPFK